MKDESFLSRLKQRLISSKTSMLEGKLDGASSFREMCKIICNLLSFQFNEDDDDDEDTVTDLNNIKVDKSKKSTARNQTIATATTTDPKYLLFVKRMQMFENFCTHLELPQQFSDLLKQLSNEKSGNKISKEVWFNHILMDCVVVIHTYFSSQMSLLNNLSQQARNNYLKYTKEFLILSQNLLNQSIDADLRIRERTMIVSLSIFFFLLSFF